MYLVTKENIHQLELEAWKKDAINRFDERMIDKEKHFPCIPATMGYQLNRFCFGFVPNPQNPLATKELALLLKEYSIVYKSIGAYTSLVIFYEPSPERTGNPTVEQYEQMFWEQLNQLSKIDEMEWPSHIPADSMHSMWEFCFHGEQFFMYCATPSHCNRYSRHFPYFMLAITPRWVLEKFTSSPLHAEKIKAKIRDRLANYDSISIHPDLNTYGQKDNYEWKQYFLRDDQTTLSKCPFHKKNREQE
ncbi:YqcI/YcgG family protein [Neobacillus sp. YX16]|uniref:YqcI/YcgG family protein n=1 Tax=Neobacillus sp. YX16 TaxID=3047874 RepID=UPI0024C367A3|nr:YqcI/YcgG family protein [Neobacillus sp. YX16]WHZ00529.1 YqcI/YcgG family protein [Neobacillus sp. YX16]